MTDNINIQQNINEIIITELNNNIIVSTPGPQGIPGTTAASVAYAYSAGSAASAIYAASAGYAPTPASVSYSASSGLSASVNYFVLVASATYAASAGNATIPASVLYSASSGIANNSASLAGQPGSYYYPASSIATASVSYATNAGNSSSTSQTNFSALTISSSPVATQSYVTGQGYLVSSGSIATASNSASLGGIAAASYALLNSPTFTGIPLAPTAASTVSNTQIATTAYVNNAVSQHALSTASIGYYGAFSSSVTQSGSPFGVARAMTLSQTDMANGVSFNSSSIIFQYPGVYNIQWSGQFQNTDANKDHDVQVYLKYNGVDVIGSTGVINIPGKTGSIAGHTIAGWNFIVPANAGDIYEFWWLTDNNLVSLIYYPTVGSVTSTQSLIVTAQMVTYIQQANSISSGSATNVTLVGTTINSGSINGGSANFDAVSISGSALATQSYVTNQGYVTSSGSVSTSSNALLLNNIPSSSFAQLDASNVFTQNQNVTAGSLTSYISTYQTGANNYQLRIAAESDGPYVEYGQTTNATAFGKSGAFGSALSFEGTARPVRFKTTVTNSVVAQIVGISGQTSDLLQIGNGITGANITSLYAGFNASGQFYTGASTALSNTQLSIIPNNASTVGGVIRAFPSQTANLQEWQNSAGTILNRLSANGGFYSTNGIYTGYETFIGISYNGVSSPSIAPLTLPTFVVKNLSGQTGDTQQLHNAAGTILAAINSQGQFYSGSTSLNSFVGGATTAASGNGTTATLTMTSITNLAVGDLIVVTGITPTGYNTTGAIVTAVSNVSPFTVSYLNTTSASQTIAGAILTPAQVSITSKSAQTIPLVIRAAASQNSYLTMWQDSSGNKRSGVLSNGDWETGALYNTYAGIGTGYSNYQGGATSLFVTPVLGTRNGQITKARSDQTADLTQWQDSTSSVLAGVTASGQFYIGASTSLTNAQLFVNMSSSIIPGVVIRQAAAGNPYLLTFQDVNGGTIASVNSAGQIAAAGRFSVGNGGAVSTTDGTLLINGSITSIGLRVRSTNAAQGVDHFRVENSAAQALLGIASAGYVYAGPGTNLTPNGRTSLIVNSGNSAGSTMEIQSTTGGQTGIFLGNNSANAYAQILLKPSTDTSWPSYLTTYTSGVGTTAAGLSQWSFLGVSPLQVSLIARPSSISAGSAIIVPIVGASANGNGTASLQFNNTTGFGINAYTVTTTGILSASNPSGTAASAFNQNRVVATFVNASVVTIPITLTDTYTSGGTLVVNQSADLQQWLGWNSSGVGLTTLAGVNWNGQFYTGTTSAPTNVQMYIQQPNTSTTGLVIKGAVGTSTLFDIQNSAGISQFYIGSGGIVQSSFLKVSNTITNNNSTAPFLSFGGNNGTAATMNTSASANIGFIIQGAVSQSGDLQQWKDSSGSILARVNASGTFNANIALGSGIYASSATPFYANSSGSVSIGNKLVWTGSALFIGDQVSGTTGFQAPLNPSSNTVAIYAGASSASSASAAPFRVDYAGNLFAASVIMTSGSSTSTPLMIKAATAQTADLQQWKDSSGSVLGKVTASGQAYFASVTTPTIDLATLAISNAGAVDAAAGEYVIFGAGTTNGVQTSNEGKIQFIPAIWSSSLAITRLAIYIAISGGPSSSIRFGAYTNDRGIPANLIADFGLVSASTAASPAVVELTLASSSTILTSGGKFYWAVCVQGNDATKPSIRIAQNPQGLWQTHMPSGGGFDAIYGNHTTATGFASAAFPSNIPRTAITVSGGQSNQTPVIRARIA